MNALNGRGANVAPSTTADDEIDLGALLNTLWRGKWFIALMAILAVVAGGYYAFVVATPMYRATSVVILEPEQQSFSGLEGLAGGGGLSGDSIELNSEVQVLRSRTLVGKVVDEMELINDPEFNGLLRAPSRRSLIIKWVKKQLGVPEAPPVPADLAARRLKDALVQALLDRLTVSNLARSYVFNITVETAGAVKSAEIADAFSRIYIQDQLQVKFDQSERATIWLTGTVSDLKIELEEAETELSVFSNSTDLISAEVLKAQEIQLKDLRERVTDAVVDENIAQQTLDAANAAGDQVAARRAELDFLRRQQQVKTLAASRDNLEQQIERQNADLITLQQFKREAEAKGLLYDYFLTRLNETTAQQGIQQPDSRILSQAVVPFGASSPKKLIILMLSGLLGVCLGSALVLWRDARRNGFVLADDLEKATGYSVLGQIPIVPGRQRGRVLNYLSDKPASVQAEAYRNLRTSVMLSNIDNPPQVILSTSCVPGEGKTTNSLVLAQNLTGLGKKVILVEGDIRKRTFGEYFKGLPEKGLVSVIMGDVALEDALYQDDRLQAAILPGDKSRMNAADVFASDRFKDLIKNLCNTYDVVLIDTPPVLAVPDARLIADVADAVLFTVKWDATPRAQVEEALRTFHNSGQSITGFVLSQINPRKMRKYGGAKGYGTYGDYGKGYYEA